MNKFIFIQLIFISTFNIFFATNTVAQNVGIGTPAPLSALHIKRDNEALRIQGATPYISFYDNAGTNKGFLQNYNDNIYLGTSEGNAIGAVQFRLNNIPHTTLLANGNFGIGTTSPVSILTIQTGNNTVGFTHQSSGPGGIILQEAIGGVSASIGTSTNHAFRLMANNNPLINLDVLGNVGVGLTDQTYKMDIADRIRIRGGSGSSTAGVWFNNITNTAATTFLGTKDVDQFGIYGSSTWNFIMNTTNGNIGIGANVPNPTNKLQIGSMGTTGFATNDLAIGNGTNALGILQSNTSTYIGSTTDIVLMPRNNGHGRVGINTNAPRYTLEVADYVLKPGSSYRYYNNSALSNYTDRCDPCDAGVSIFAANAIYASEFDAYSDARIKTIEDISNSTNDLETINSLKITDYTMKDKVKYGNKPFKKVIAQEVEKVYPQVVSKHADFIPNVYQVSSRVEKIPGGYLLTFTTNHSISKDAKKLRVLLSEGEGMQEVTIVAMPSDKQIIINAPDIKSDKVFVYGEEVDDFRTVDYEGLTTLNISATQELSKLVKKQQAAIDLLEKRLVVMEAQNKGKLVMKNHVIRKNSLD